MIVIDASAVLEILGGTETGRDLEIVLGSELHAPHIIDLEVANALRRWEMSGVVNSREAAGLLELFRRMPILRHEHEPLLDRIWALRHNLTAYDASYLALARMLGAELVTLDDGLQKAARRRLH